MSEEYNEMYERSFEGPKPKLKGKLPLIIIFSALAVCFVIAAGLYLLWPEDEPFSPIVMKQITAQIPDPPVSKEESSPLTTGIQEQSIQEDTVLSSEELIVEVQEILPEDSTIQVQASIPEINNVNADPVPHADEADELKEVVLSEESVPIAEIKQDNIIKQEPVALTEKIEEKQSVKLNTPDKTMPVEIKNSSLKKTSGYMVQVGSFTSISRANIIKGKLEKKGFNAFILTASLPELGIRYRVRVGGYETRSNADDAAKKFKEMGMPTLIISPAR